jgi:hypothetical protein
MRSSTTQDALETIRSRAAGFILSLSLLALPGAGFAADGMYLELPGLERAEITSAKLGDGMQVATGIAGRCEAAKRRVIVEREFGPPAFSAAVQNATANGTSFDYVIVYRNNAQFWMHDAVITSYSLSGAVGGGLIERFEMEISDITVQPD